MLKFHLLLLSNDVSEHTLRLVGKKPTLSDAGFVVQVV